MGSSTAIARAPEGVLQFLPGYEQTSTGEFRAGGRLTIHYDPNRVPCRRERLGIQIGHLVPFIRFRPGEQLYQGEGTEFSVPIPSDATTSEIWFYSWNSMACTAWDSRFGQNYDCAIAGPASAVENVTYRNGAIASVEMVNTIGASASKVRHSFDPAPSAGAELQTRLAITAWVRNVAYEKNVWMDLHVFDKNDSRVHAETLTLQYTGSSRGDGDLFQFDDVVFHGSGGGPGSAWNAADARTVQCRLYYEVNGQVFTDGLLRQWEVQADDLVWNPPNK